jgi:hypothetical protein
MNIDLKLIILSVLISLLFLVPQKVQADTVWTRHTIDNAPVGADGLRLTDVNGDGYLDIAAAFESGGVSKVYINPGPSNVTSTWEGVQVGSSMTPEDAVLADLDSDGQYDVISSSATKAEMYINWAPSLAADYLNAAVWTTELLPVADDLGRWIYALPYQVDGENGIDIIAGATPSIKGLRVGWFESPADPRVLADWEYHAIDDTTSWWTMSLIMQDMDGDGDRDLYTTDRKGARWLENPGHGPAQENEWQNHQIMTGFTLFGGLGDLDEDGLLDSVVGLSGTAAFNGGGVASIVFSNKLDTTGENWQNYTIAWPSQAGTEPKGINIADIDNDGNKDLVATSSFADTRQGVFWLSYPTSPTDTTWEYHEISGADGGDKFDDVIPYDVDADGDLDVFTTEENGGEENNGLGVIWYENPFGPSVSASTGSPSSGSNETSSLNCTQIPPGSKAPLLYEAVPQSSSSVLLYFATADGPLDHYALEYGTKSGQYIWGSTNIGDRDARTYMVNFLFPNTTFYFRIRAGNGCAPGGWSNEISATTKFITSLSATSFNPAGIANSVLEVASVIKPEPKINETPLEKIFIAHEDYESEQSLNVPGVVREPSNVTSVAREPGLDSTVQRRKISIILILLGLLIIIGGVIFAVSKFRTRGVVQ